MPGRQHVDLSQRQRSLPDATGFSGNRRAQLGKQAAFDVDDLFLGIENLGLVFFQLRRGEALGVDQGLLALIVGRSQVQIGLRNLEVVAKNRIELHLERRDPGPLPLPLLDLGQKLFAVAAQVAQLVEFMIDARCESRRRRSEKLEARERWWCQSAGADR